MMRELNECKAEVFRRSEVKKNRYRRIRFRVISCLACLCLCLTAVGIGLSLAGAPEVAPVSSVPDAAESTQPAEQSQPSEVSNPMETSRPAELKPTVITSDIFDASAPEEQESIPSKNGIYISPVLQELMQREYETEVVFRVLVGILTVNEDYQEAKEYLDTVDELNALYEKVKASSDAYKEAEERFEQNHKDESKRAELLADLSEKREYMLACHNEWSKLRAEIERAYLEDIYSARLEYAYTIGAENVKAFETSSDLYYYGYVMDLSADMINDMAAQGGYSFRMAPPERVEGYDVRIADHLTILLDKAAEDEVLHVAVVCTADNGNFFASERGIPVNGWYNDDLYRLWKFPSGSGMTGKERYDSLVDYVNAVIERNGLTDKHIVDDKHPDVDIYLSQYDEDGDVVISSAAVGFEVKATKAEILALAEDPDVRLICSMSFAMEQNDLPEND